MKTLALKLSSYLIYIISSFVARGILLLIYPDNYYLELYKPSAIIKPTFGSFGVGILFISMNTNKSTTLLKQSIARFKLPLALSFMLFLNINLYSQIEKSPNDTLFSAKDFSRITDTTLSKYYLEFYDSIIKAISDHKWSIDTNNLFYFIHEEPFIYQGYITFHIWTIDAINDFLASQKHCESETIKVGPYGGLIQGDLYLKFYIETKEFHSIYQIE